MIKHLTILLLFFITISLKATSIDEKTVLILVDIQNDYFQDGLAPMYNAEFTTENTAKLLQKFRLENREVIHVQHTNTSGFFLANTFGQEIHKMVTPIENEMVFQKTQVSTFTNPDFEPYLNQKGYEHLIVCGMQTNVCVQAIANDAVNKGFEVTIVEECVAAVDEATHNQTINTLSEKCNISNSLDILSNVFDKPESIVFDSISESYFISNPGNGTIIKIDTSGVPSLFQKELGVPIGLAILDTVLYVAIQTKVEGFSLNTGNKTFELTIPEAVGINGLATDNDSLVFASDDTKNCIYGINVHQQTAKTIIDEGMQFPNGLEYDKNNNRLLICTATGNRILSYSFTDKLVTELVAESYGGLDGLAINENGEFYVSSWGTNSVYLYNADFSNSTLVSTKHNGPADIYYNTKRGVLAIPNMNGNYIDMIDVNKATSIQSANIQAFATQAQLGSFDKTDSKQSHKITMGNFGLINDSVFLEIKDLGNIDASAISISKTNHFISPYATKQFSVSIDPELVDEGSHTIKLKLTTNNNQTSFDYTIRFNIVDNSTNIKTNPDQGLLVYPNPAKDFISITNNQSKSFSIYNVTGKLILSDELANNNSKINISNLNQGIYLIKTECSTIKFIKE